MNQFLKNILLLFLKLLPLRNIIIFESHGDFCDNTRVLFEYMISIDLNKKYKMIWLVQDISAFTKTNIENVTFIHLPESNHFELLIYYYYISVARYAFYSHRRPPAKHNHGEIFVNLWHGSGLKKPKSLNFDLNFDFVHCNSDYFKKARIKYYNCDSTKLVSLGNPRNDLLFHKSDSIRQLVNKTYSKCIIWMPTFRVAYTGRKEFINLSDTDYPLPVIQNDNQLEQLDVLLSNHDTLLIVKPHPMEDLSKLSLTNTNNIKIVTNQLLDSKCILLYSLLGESDALITDISSVFVDYLLINRQVGFTVNDISDYTSGLNTDTPLSLMPGAHINNYKEFIEFISDVINNNDIYKSDREKVNLLLNHYRDGSYSKRIVDFYKIS